MIRIFGNNFTIISVIRELISSAKHIFWSQFQGYRVIFYSFVVLNFGTFHSFIFLASGHILTLCLPSNICVLRSTTWESFQLQIIWACNLSLQSTLVISQYVQFFTSIVSYFFYKHNQLEQVFLSNCAIPTLLMSYWWKILEIASDCLLFFLSGSKLPETVRLRNEFCSDFAFFRIFSHLVDRNFCAVRPNEL